MPRNMLPMKPGGTVSKVVTVVVLLAVLTLVIGHPADAASWTISVVHLVGRVIGGISSFLHDLLG